MFVEAAGGVCEASLHDHRWRGDDVRALTAASLFGCTVGKFDSTPKVVEVFGGSANILRFIEWFEAEWRKSDE